MCGHSSAERQINSGKTEEQNKFKSCIVQNICQADL